MVTQENIEVQQDEIDQIQQDLDVEQGTPAAPTYVTMEDVQRLIEQQQASFQAQVSGLASKVDTSANAIRRDITKSAEDRIQQLEQQLKSRQVLDAIPEEHREWLGPILQQTLLQNAPQPTAVPQPVEQSAQVPQIQQELNQAMEIIRKMGGDPQSSSINYGAYLQGDNDGFLASVGNAIRGTAAAQATAPNPAPTQRQAPPPQVNPPVEAPSGGTRTDLTRVDSVRDAYILGQIDEQEYADRMQKLGVQV